MFRPLKQFILLAVLSAIAACGGGGGTASTPAAGSNVDPKKDPLTFNINVTLFPSSGGNVLGAGTYKEGEQVTLNATAVPGYNFINWTEDGVEVSADPIYIFTTTGERTLKANFKSQPIIEPTSLQISEWRKQYSIPLNAHNPEGKSFNIEVVAPPHHGRIATDDEGLTVIYTPPANGFFSDHFDLRIFNGLHWSEIQRVDVTYVDVNETGIPDFIEPGLGGASSLAGIIDDDLHLTAGTYLVEGDLQIRHGATFRLDPGVTLLFKDGKALTVAGSLIANASHKEMIRLLPASIDPEGWLGLRFIEGHTGSTIDQGQYMQGTLIKGLELAGVAESVGGRVISVCASEPSTYLFEEVLVHGTIGNTGTIYIGKCDTFAYQPNLIIRKSVFHIDDRGFDIGFPTKAFDTARVNLSDSLITGYTISPISRPGDVVHIERSIIDVKPAADWASQPLSFQYTSSEASSVVNTIIIGGIGINRGFLQNLYPLPPTFENNIVSIGASKHLIVASGSATPDDTIILGNNYYIFAGNELEVVLDGRREVGRPIVDISQRLQNEPEAGPSSLTRGGLDSLQRRLLLRD